MAVQCDEDGDVEDDRLSVHRRAGGRGLGVVEWNEGRSFKYRGEGAPMMRNATNLWSVETRGNQTLVTSSAEVVLKGGLFGLLLEPLVKLVATRLGEQSLASLKYFVEQGHPYPGRARDLLPAPAVC